MKKKLLRAYAILMLLFNMSISVSAASASPMLKVQNVASKADDPFSVCENLDVVFVIDQSSSMGGADPGNMYQLASDPLFQREHAVEGMIDLLVDLAVDQCADNSYRVAVVSFGGKDLASIDLPLSNIDPSSAEQGRELRNKLVESVQAKDLWETYPQYGFKKAAEIFNNSESFGDQPRKKVIIFLTDGLPCSMSASVCSQTLDYQVATQDVINYISQYFSFDEKLLQYENCVSDLRDQYSSEAIPPEKANACLSIIPENEKKAIYERSTYIYVLLLKSDQVYPLNVLDQFETMAKAYGSEKIELKQNLSDVPSTMRQILSNLVGIRPNLLACGNPFAVNPYLKRIRINVYNISTENKISLSYVDSAGQTHSVQYRASDPSYKNIDPGFTLAEPYYSYGANERYVFAYPYPGQWQVEAENCSGVDIYADAIPMQDFQDFRPNLPSALPQYDRDPFYSMDEPFYIEYQMKVGDVLVEQPAYPLFALKGSVDITLPEGSKFPEGKNSYSIPLQYDAAKKALVSSEPLMLPVPGDYKLSISASTAWYPGKDYSVPSNKTDAEIFDTNRQLFRFENGFTVYPVTPFTLQAVSPKPGEKKTYPVHKSLLNGGWPLKLAPLTIRQELVFKDGSKVTNWQDILADGDNAVACHVEAADGKQSGTVNLKPDVDGSFFGEVSDFSSPGPQTVVCKIVMGAVSKTYRPYEQKVEIPIKRADGFMTTPLAYLVMFWLFIGFIVLNIILFFANRTSPVRGNLVFEDGGEEIANFNLHKGINVREIQARELKRYPQLGLKKISARNINMKKSRKPADDFSDSGNSNRIRAIFVSKSGRKFSIDLYPDTPADYGDEGLGMVVYKSV